VGRDRSTEPAALEDDEGTADVAADSATGEDLPFDETDGCWLVLALAFPEIM
jgi:hypothetical protein